MISVSNEFKTAMKQPVKEIQAYINGDISIKSEDDLISFKISCDSGLCKTAMRKLEAKYTGEHNLLGQEVQVGFGVKLSDGTFEYLDYGSFLISEITTTKDTGVTNIVGYDYMVKSMTQYTTLDVEYPIRLIDYTRLLCEACGLELGNDIFGKNLFNKDNTNVLNAYITGSTATTLSATSYGKTIYIECEPNTTYSIQKLPNRFFIATSTEVPLVGATIENVKNAKDTGTNYIYTTNENAKYLIIYVLYTNGANVTLDEMLASIQIEKSSTVTDYQAYNTMNDYPVNTELWENIDGITYRDIFQQIAQATGTTCIISNDNKVYFKELTNTGESLTYDNMFKLKLEPKYGEINSVVIGREPIVGEDVFLKDDASIETNGLTEFKISNNEIIDKDRESAIVPLYNILKGTSYYPFESTTEGLGWFEIADKIDIVNDTGDVFNTSLFNYTINIDGAVGETLKTSAQTKTQTQYQYATQIDRRVKNTEIIVNKQEEYIQQLVSDMYEENGVVNENFTKVYQNVNEIVNSVQNSGGSNLIKNSVMFAYDNDNVPSNWNVARAGKNICPTDFSYWESGQYSTAGNKGEWLARVRLIDLIPVTPNTKYYLNTNNNAHKFVIRGFDENKNFKLSYGAVNNGTSIHTNNIYYWGITLYNPNNDSQTYNRYSELETLFNNGEIKPFICLESETDKSFEPYTEGELTMTSNTESLNAGCLSGHSFTLGGKKADQRILVSMDTVYSFTTNIKKKITGSCYVKLYNDNEEHVISLESGEEAFYKEYTLANLQPKDSYYIIEFYGSVDSEATFTDNMLAVGEYPSKWTQANGEIMNTQVNVTIDGVLVKSTIYQGDYTIMSPLEFAGYSNINGTITKVFTLNKDTTYMTKAEVKDQFKMSPIKIVPIRTGARKGWAFVPVVEEASE